MPADGAVFLSLENSRSRPREKTPGTEQGRGRDFRSVARWGTSRMSTQKTYDYMINTKFFTSMLLFPVPISKELSVRHVSRRCYQSPSIHESTLCRPHRMACFTPNFPVQPSRCFCDDTISVHSKISSAACPSRACYSRVHASYLVVRPCPDVLEYVFRTSLAQHVDPPHPPTPTRALSRH